MKSWGTLQFTENSEAKLPKYRQLAEALSHWIERDLLPAGPRLPEAQTRKSERQISCTGNFKMPGNAHMFYIGSNNDFSAAYVQLGPNDVKKNLTFLNMLYDCAGKNDKVRLCPSRTNAQMLQLAKEGMADYGANIPDTATARFPAADTAFRKKSEWASKQEDPEFWTSK